MLKDNDKHDEKNGNKKFSISQVLTHNENSSHILTSQIILTWEISPAFMLECFCCFFFEECFLDGINSMQGLKATIGHG